MALALSGAVTVSILLFTPGGLPSLRKRQSELVNHKFNLLGLSKQNQHLLDEVRRLGEKDPELMENLVRRLGYDRPGEKVYIFGDQAARR
jgi:hypothetical protein